MHKTVLFLLLYFTISTVQAKGVQIIIDGKTTEMKGNIQYRKNNSFSDILNNLNVKI